MTNWFRRLIPTVRKAARGFVRPVDGADLIEYALLGTVIALAAYAGVTAVGNSLGGAFTAVTNGVVSQGQAGAALAGGGGTTGGGTTGGTTGDTTGGTTGGTTGDTTGGTTGGTTGRGGGTTGGGNGNANGNKKP